MHCPENVLEACGNRSSSAASPCSSPEPAGSWPQWGWTCHTHSLAALVNDTCIIATHCCQYLAGQGHSGTLEKFQGCWTPKGMVLQVWGQEGAQQCPGRGSLVRAGKGPQKEAVWGQGMQGALILCPGEWRSAWGQSPKGRSEMSFHSHAELG